MRIIAMYALLSAFMIVFIGCSSPEFDENGVTLCGTDLPGGRCPASMVCCSGRCYSSRFLPSTCALDATREDTSAMGTDTDAVTDNPSGDAPQTETNVDVLQDTAHDVMRDTSPNDIVDAEDVMSDAVDVIDSSTDVLDAGDLDASRDADATLVADVDARMTDVIDVPDTIDVSPDVRPDVLVDTGQDRVCATGLTMCGINCVDTSSSLTHCGRCDNPCVNGSTCVSSTCVCSAGLRQCAGRCVDLRTDPAHCGACGSICTAPALCLASVCIQPSGRITLEPLQIACWQSDAVNQSFDTIRNGTTSSQFDFNALNVAAYRYINRNASPAMRLARIAARFRRPTLPPATRVYSVSFRLVGIEVANEPAQIMIVVPFTGAQPWSSTRWPLSNWGVTRGGGSPDSPTPWSERISVSLFAPNAMPGPYSIALNATGVTGLFSGTGDLSLGIMEIHDAYGNMPDQVPMDTFNAGISFANNQSMLQLFIDYGP